ncbi:MAG: ATP-binding protein, partial [Deltaproteobacteria bacterium]|nr:ATP-binding protein [Deltaproteobacteria bacterium]
VDLACQLPTFTLVGLPSSLTQESRERIRAAIVNSGFEWPARKITINLLPANLPKWGSHYELAMALGVLGAATDEPCPPNVLALGELSLSGRLRACGWLPAIADWIRRRAESARCLFGEPLMLVAHERDVRQLCAAMPDIGSVCELVAVSSLAEAFRRLTEAGQRLSTGAEDGSSLEDRAGRARAAEPSLRLLARVEGEPLGTLAGLVAIAGGHHALFAGPQGVGKSMLVRAICEGSFPLGEPEAAERSGLLSSFGELFESARSEPLSPRPVVRLQASISRAALEGALLNSGQVLPGELTRAHLGVLVADELLEFRRDVIEAFRQPLDESLVRLQRAKFRTVLPAKFQLLATTNLCPCGVWVGIGSDCRCSDTLLRSYQAKLSGPMLDRLDLIVLMGRRARKGPVTKLPGDLRQSIDELLDARTWRERLANFHSRAGRATDGDDPASLWSQLSCSASDRGKLKLARVARTVAALLDERRTIRHLRIAQLLRFDLPSTLSHAAPKFEKLRQQRIAKSFKINRVIH